MNVEQLQSSVLCNVRFGWWGASAQYDKNKLGDSVPKEIVRAVQDLLDDKSNIDEIKRNMRRLHVFLTNNSLPCPMKSVFLIPKERVSKVHDEINAAIERMQEPLNSLINDYGKLKNAFKKKYPDQYRPEKYPNRRQLRARFYIKSTFFQVGMPDQALTELDPDQYKQVAERFKTMADEIEEMTITMIGNELITRLNKLQKQCETGKGLHGKTVNSVNRFLANWKDLWEGHIDNKKLNNVLEKCRAEMKKVHIERLRNNEDFRTEMAGKIKQVMDSLDKMPDVNLKRKIDI